MQFLREITVLTVIINNKLFLFELYRIIGDCIRQKNYIKINDFSMKKNYLSLQ